VTTTVREPELLRERRGGVEILTLNRPEVRNALSQQLLVDIAGAMADADADPDVRVVVLTATGTKAFCAGMDLRELAAGPSPVVAPREPRRPGFGDFLRDGISKPLIGAANGVAVGGGFELLLPCDLIVASEDARFGLTEVKRGLIPGGVGIILGRRLPLAVALEMTMTGETISAGQAQAYGLVNRVAAPDEVLAEALRLADAVAAAAPLAVAAVKQLVRAAADRPLEEVWALQDELRPAVFGSDDAREGAAAFVERREPRWTGR
jgi:enoyl-CoA hydratase/carnithine racemase